MQSAFAPTSHRSTGCAGAGSGMEIAGRCTPFTRPITSVAAARQAPVEPAEKKPAAAPSFTSRQPTTSEESFLARTARAGCSAMSMTSVVAFASQRSCSAANGSTTSAGPQRTTFSFASASSAAATPSSTTPGALSPPMASTAMTVSAPAAAAAGAVSASRFLLDMNTFPSVPRTQRPVAKKPPTHLHSHDKLGGFLFAYEEASKQAPKRVQ